MEVSNLLAALECDAVNILEDLAEVSLYAFRIVRGFSEDLEELVVREEVEAAEFCALASENEIKRVLDLLKVLVALLKHL